MRYGPMRQGDERGQVAIIVALTLTLILAFGALVVDVGLNWAARSEAQGAADAAALAGAALLPADPPGAATVVKDYLDRNVPGLTGTPSDPQWASNGDDSDGEITCYAPPAAPVLGDGCQPGAPVTAIQVITPPLQPTYAFASILGRSSNSIKALASAGATPGQTAPCGLCVLGPEDLTMSGGAPGQLTVRSAGVVVNSSSRIGTGSLGASSIGVAGVAQSTPPGSYTPAATEGVPVVADPLSGLPTPAQLVPQILNPGTQAGSLFTQGVFGTINLTGPATFRPGIYVITGGLRLSGNANVTATGVTLYFACDTYPAPCQAGGGPGAGLSVTGNAQLLLTAPGAVGPPAYRHLAIFSDRENTAGITFGSGVASAVTGSVYAARSKLTLDGKGAILNSMVVVGSADVAGTGSYTVAYDPSQNVSLQGASGGLLK
jgi:Putative Flp pilus-assembly TadE/G-like